VQLVGTVRALYRYPVKSMAGQALREVSLGWHGVEGDRRFAFVRESDVSAFPWLTASKLHSLILYQPLAGNGGDEPTHVLTPGRETLELRSDELRRELSEKHGMDVKLMQLKNGIFDDAPLSLITTGTIDGVATGAARALDARRFRPNIVVETKSGEAFAEDAWIGKVVRFEDRAAMHVEMSDVRCSMINLEPDTAAVQPEVLKSAVRLNRNCAGIYGSTYVRGEVRVGDAVWVE
jgi:uncharacterized protein YcbX